MKEIGPMAWKPNMIWVKSIVDWFRMELDSLSSLTVGPNQKGRFNIPRKFIQTNENINKF